MSTDEAIAPDGQLTLAAALGRAEIAWRPSSGPTAVDRAALPQKRVRQQSFPGGETWVSAEHDAKNFRTPSRAEAWNRLRRNLADGKLLALVLRSSGEFVGIPPGAWRRSQNADADLSGQISYSTEMGPIDGDVFIRSADLEALLSGIATEQILPGGDKPPVSSGKSTHKGGAPTQYDWDAAWVEVLRIFLYDANPPNRAALSRLLYDWFSKTGRAVPGETAMKGKMRVLYEMIDAEVKKAVTRVTAAKRRLPPDNLINFAHSWIQELVAPRAEIARGPS